MPFGLTNAVATFCALADHILSGLQWSFCLCFIDDCLIFSPNDFNLHLKHIDLVLSRLQKANLKLKLRKCHFAGSEAPFLGHIVWRRGLLQTLYQRFFDYCSTVACFDEGKGS